MTGAAARGLRNPFRSRTRAAVVVLLLAVVTGFLGLMVQAALASRQQIARLDARVRTLIELREAGAFGTGGFGGDKPVGEEHFSVDTLERLWRIPHAAHLARVDEYVYTPQIDTARPNAYAMIIGLRPGAAMRAIGEVDYENARIVALNGHPFAIVGIYTTAGDVRGQPRPRHEGQGRAGHGQGPQGDTDPEGHRSRVAAGPEREPGHDRVRE